MKKCKNPACPKGLFRQGRRHQEFCSKTCRNAYNNLQYQQRRKPCLELVERLLEQEAILNGLLAGNACALIREDTFPDYGIDSSAARQLHYNNQVLQRIEFVSFVLTRHDSLHFQLKKR